MKKDLLALISLLCCSCSSTKPLEVVQHVDLARYLGTWYEIARLPAWFEKDCTGVTATYSMREDGKIKVVNACRKGALDGPVKEAVGKAWVHDKTTNAKLKVMFFWPFAGDYWIIDLDNKDYKYAVVGDPGRKYFWVLSRTPKMDEDLLNALLEKAKKQGYNLDKLIRTPQGN
jgi:apolipoprotein D and lipocalin family protein